MKKYLLVLVVFLSALASLNSQNLNAYKYVIVPVKYDFLKEQNQYQLNELTKFLFEKSNFEVIMEGSEMPADWVADNCIALYVDVEDDSKLFNTTLKLILKDCGKKVILESQNGSSREKDYKTAYHEALREAYKSFESLDHSYEPKLNSNATASTKVPTDEVITNTIDKVKEVEEVIVSAIPIKLNVEEKSTTEENANKQLSFNIDGKQFFLEKTDFGFYLTKEQDSEAIAKLINTSLEGHYIYKTIKSNGLAYFDTQGNLVVEVLNGDTNATSIIKYSKN